MANRGVRPNPLVDPNTLLEKTSAECFYRYLIATGFSNGAAADRIVGVGVVSEFARSSPHNCACGRAGGGPTGVGFLDR